MKKKYKVKDNVIFPNFRKRMEGDPFWPWVLIILMFLIMVVPVFMLGHNE